MTAIAMPKLSDSMEEGTILSWLKASGERVAEGEELLEIETDKSTATFLAEAAGFLEIVVEVGTTVPVGDLIARIQEAPAGSQPSSAVATPVALAEQVTIDAPREPPVATLEKPDTVRGNGGSGRSARSGQLLKATPLAWRVAAAEGVDLESVQGTGPQGRITRADVLSKAGLTAPVSSAPRPPATLAPAPTAPAPPAPNAGLAHPPGTTLQKLSRLQQLIARRMSEAKTTIPHFQVQTDVKIGAAVALRKELKGAAGEQDVVPSLNDLIVKSVALALRDHPLANGSYRDDGFELHQAINIGIAVAADDALVVPTVFNADAKSLGEIARESRRLAGRVRSGEVTPQELSGGTFTVSNLGMFGMTAITPVINPPQAAILGVGAMRETLARVDGEIVDRPLLTLTLSCDHRILYGADAARFVARIRDLLETPLRLAL